MDCEGGEYDLVYKSSPASWATVQRLVLEYHDVPGESWEEFRAWFAGVGLHVLRDERGPIAGTAWLSRTPLRDHEGRGPRTRASKLALRGPPRRPDPQCVHQLALAAVRARPREAGPRPRRP